jgi:anti-sigma B factor antagonist
VEWQGHHGFAEAPFFACRLQQDGTTLRLELAGEVDLAARPELDRLLSEADGLQGGAVLVDLTRATFLDSTGLQWLLRVREAITRSGASLAVAVPDGPVRDVLRVSGIDRMLALAPAVAEE